MTMHKFFKKIKSFKKNNHGSTFVEMIVCFALLSLFMVCAAIIISSITTMYYNIKGEIYSRQVSDIVLEKISSEIDGAEYDEDITANNPIISDSRVELFDKTGTKVILSLDTTNNKGLLIQYPEIVYIDKGIKDQNKSKKATEWYFDESMYNGFVIQELSFYQGGNATTVANAGNYGLAGINMADYGENVVLVLLKINSDRYGTYYFHRFVRMYNYPQSASAPAPGP